LNDVNNISSTPQSRTGRDPRHGKLLGYYPLVIIGILPMTAAALRLLSLIPPIAGFPDINGLIAVSVGILGLIIFYIFLYKYQITARLTRRTRYLLMGLHVAITALLFLGLIWLGFNSPWHAAHIWGNYEYNTAVRSWIIAVLVLGVITLLGSLFDCVRRGGGE